MGLFLISFASAWTSDNFILDNQKVNQLNTETKYGTYEIIYHQWWDVLKIFTERKVKEITLNENSDICGGDNNCYANFQTEVLEKSSMVDNFNFYNKQTMELDSVRWYRLEYWGEKIEPEINCEDSGIKNESGSGNLWTCSEREVNNGEDWIIFNEGDEFEIGNYTWRVVASKPTWKEIEWTFEINGIETTEWSTWGAVGGANSWVNLTNPSNGGIATSNPVTFNATINLIGGGYLHNASLWNNFSGVWNRNQTINLFNTYKDEEGLTLGLGSETAMYGIKFTANQDVMLVNVTRYAGSTPTRCMLKNTDGTVALAVGIFVGEDCNLNYQLTSGTAYRIMLNATGSYTNANAGSPAYPRAGSSGNITYTTGINSVGGEDATSWSTALGNLTLVKQFLNLTNQSIIANITKSGVWNIQGCDSDGACGFATSNFTLLLDTTAPQIVMNYGNGTLNYGNLNTNHTINYTITDLGLDSCWLEYDGVNYTAPCTSGQMNTTNFALTLGEYSATLWANDSLNNLAEESFSWNYSVLENNRSYQNPVSSGSIESFNLNVTLSPIVTGINIFLNYNNTNYTMSTSNTGYTRVYNSNITIPSVLTQQNKTFYFISLVSTGSGTSQYISLEDNQTINPFLIDNCVSYTKRLMNISMYDEDNLAGINGTILLNLNLYSYGTNNLVSSYNSSFNYNTSSPISICFNEINNSYHLDYTMKYYGNNSYYPEYKSIQRMTINNQTLYQNISLYDLLQSSGKNFKIIVVGNFLSPTGNRDLLVDIQRQYLSQNQFISVESPITSSDGTASGALVENSEIYNFIVSYNGEVLGTFNNYQVKCQNPATEQCSISLNLASATGSIENFLNYGNISSFFLLDNSTNILYHTYSSTDGLTHSVNSLVIKNDAFANETICNNTASGTSGTIQCALPVIYRNDSFVVKVSVDGEYVGAYYFYQGTSVDWQGIDIFIELLMFTSLVLLFIGHPITIVIGALIGLIMPLVLLFVTAGTFGSILATIIYYVLAGGIIIWLISKKI
jgi:hypothetical protein